MVKEFLSQRGIAFEERDVSRDPMAGREMVNRTGQTGVPVTLIDGQTIVGFDQARLESAIVQMRKPAAGLGAAVANARALPGAYIGRVRPGSAAHRLGLLTGDIIVDVNHHPVSNANDLEQIITGLAPGALIQVTFIRNGAESAAQGSL